MELSDLGYTFRMEFGFKFFFYLLLTLVFVGCSLNQSNVRLSPQGSTEAIVSENIRALSQPKSELPLPYSEWILTQSKDVQEAESRSQEIGELPKLSDEYQVRLHRNKIAERSIASIEELKAVPEPDWKIHEVRVDHTFLSEDQVVLYREKLAKLLLVQIQEDTGIERVDLRVGVSKNLKMLAKKLSGDEQDWVGLYLLNYRDVAPDLKITPQQIIVTYRRVTE